MKQMKFNFINYSKLNAILLSSILVFNLLGCSNTKATNSNYNPNENTANSIEAPIETNTQKKSQGTSKKKIKDKTSNNSYEETKQVITSTETIKENAQEKEEITESTPENNQEKEVITEITSSTYTEVDEKVIKEVEQIDGQVTSLLEEGNDKSIQDKAKGVFISLVDFVFYEGEINGVTFNELSEEGKQKVLNLISNIDTKIENKFPNYKENISSKATNTFKKASELIQKGSKNIQEFSKEKLGEDNYQALIDAKDELVYYTKNAIHIIGNTFKNIWDSTEEKRIEVKEDIKDLWNSGKTKVKNWYEEWKNN